MQFRLRGHWSLVTGASSGIGREFCTQLAARGANVILVARREGVLRDLAETLRARDGAQTLVVPADLSVPGSVEEVRRRVASHGVRIRLLVNNAGVWHWGCLEGQPGTECRDMIRVNVMAVVQMARAFLADLGSHPDGTVLNVSSPAAQLPMPYAAVYAATKAFVHSFSQALAEECRGRGVRVKALVPGPTRTGFAGRQRDTHPFGDRFGSPADVVKVALDGLDRRGVVIAHARWTCLLRVAAALAPPSWLTRIVARRLRPPPSATENAR
jgi:short-subunit dehydrogenase